VTKKILWVGGVGGVGGRGGWDFPVVGRLTRDEWEVNVNETEIKMIMGRLCGYVQIIVFYLDS
jgi:hypothetical protein